jgi:hypothetical protein
MQSDTEPRRAYTVAFPAAHRRRSSVPLMAGVRHCNTWCHVGKPSRVGGIPHQRKGGHGHVWAYSPHEDTSFRHPLQESPFSSRDHQPRRLVVLPLLSQHRVKVKLTPHRCKGSFDKGGTSKITGPHVQATCNSIRHGDLRPRLTRESCPALMRIDHNSRTAALAGR